MTIKSWGLAVCLLLCATVALGQSAPPWQPDAYAKDRVCFNVIDYGAKGDSSTNDRAAIQSAIDAAHLFSKDSGAVVYLPAADSAYLIDTTLTLYDHITIEGAGWGSLICMAAAEDHPVFANADTAFGHDTSIVIRNLRIDGGKSSYSTYADVETADLILLRGVTKPIVEGCYLSYSAKDCIAFRNCLSPTARDNTVWNPGEECITISGHSAVHAIISNNTVRGRDSTYEDGSGAKGSLILIKAPHVEVYGNYGKYGAVAIDINGEAGDTLHHINVHDNHWESVMGTAITLTGTKWCTIEDEHIENCYGYGIYVGRWANESDTLLPHAITIKNNIIVNQQAHTGLSRSGHGILVCYGEDHQITGNTIDTCSGRGIWTSQGATNLKISNNEVNKATRDAIRLDSAWNSTLSFNDVYDADSIGFYISDTLRDTADLMNILGNRAVSGGGHGFYINNIMSSVICYNHSDSNDYDNTKNGFHMHNCRNDVILGNVARGNYYGFNLNGNCVRNMFSFNHAGGNVGSGITGQGSGNFTIANIHDLGELNLDSLPPVRAYVDAYLAGLEITNSPAAGQVLKYGTDSVYWADEAGSGSGTTDSVYVKYADSFNTQGWLTPEDTLFVDTTTGGGSSGDITAVTAGYGISGGGEDGDVTIGIDSALFNDSLEAVRADIRDSSAFEVGDSLSYSVHTRYLDTAKVHDSLDVVRLEIRDTVNATVDVKVSDSAASTAGFADSTSSVDTTYAPLVAIINRLIADSLADIDSTNVTANSLSMSGDLHAFSSSDLAGRLSDENGTGAVVLTDGATITPDSVGGDTVTVNNSLTVPQGTNPTTGALGRLAQDSDDGALEIYDTTVDASVLIPFRQHKRFCIFEPDGVDDSLFIFYVDSLMYPHGIKLCKLRLHPGVDSCAYTISFAEWSDSVHVAWIDTLANTTANWHTTSTTFTDSDIAPGHYIKVGIPATDIDQIDIDMIFYVKEGD